MITTKEKLFKLDNFEGPLDLLLSLIQTNKMDILKLSLVDVADQFVDYVKNSEFLNLDLASEYMLLSSQLIAIKSRHILRTDIFIEPNEYEEETEDLLDRLIKYEKFKNLSSDVEEIFNSSKRYEKTNDNFEEYIEDEIDWEVEIVSPGTKELIQAINNVITRHETSLPKKVKIELKKITSEQRTKQINLQLEENCNTSFSKLLNGNYDKHYASLTLLVLLELTSKNKINLIQLSNLSDIEIRCKSEG
ncbi:MAG: hypothetical protein GQ557_00860 [Mycoplasmataceae bacterium]|nr:hypothetical protein [Mycoplasmataceae bacterium]